MKKSKQKMRQAVDEYFDAAGRQNSISYATFLLKKARRLAQKIRFRLPSSQQRRFCKHCYSYLIPGRNCRVRVRDTMIVYFCEHCRRYTRFRYK